MTNRDVIKRLRALKQFADKDTQDKIDYAINTIEMRETISKNIQRYKKLTATEQNIFADMTDYYFNNVIVNDKGLKHWGIFFDMKYKILDVLTEHREGF